MNKLILTMATIFLTFNLVAQNWTLQNSNTIDNIVDVYFKNEAQGYFLTNTGKLYKTTDYGNSWNMIYQDSDFVDTLYPDYPTKNLELVITNDSIFCYSSNISNPTTIRLSASLLNTVFIKDSFNFKITNPQFWNNEIWTVEKVNQMLGISDPFDTYQINGDFISASNNVNIYFSSDFGNSWTSKQFTTPMLSSPPYQSFFNGNDSLITVTNYPTILRKSIDFGTNWNTMSNTLSGIYFYFLNYTNYLAYDQFGNRTKIYTSNNGGVSFNEESLINYINGIYTLNNFNSIYVFGRNGMLYKSTNGGGLMSTEYLEKEKIHVYPNPCKDYININNESNLLMHKIKIFDTMGNCVIEENQNFSKIDLSKLKSGTYYTTLIFKNNEITTLKFIKK